VAKKRRYELALQKILSSQRVHGRKLFSSSAEM
jgi:hypothetical protein